MLPIFSTSGALALGPLRQEHEILQKVNSSFFQDFLNEKFSYLILRYSICKQYYVKIQDYLHHGNRPEYPP